MWFQKKWEIYFQILWPSHNIWTVLSKKSHDHFQALILTTVQFCHFLVYWKDCVSRSSSLENLSKNDFKQKIMWYTLYSSRPLLHLTFGLYVLYIVKSKVEISQNFAAFSEYYELYDPSCSFNFTPISDVSLCNFSSLWLMLYYKWP